MSAAVATKALVKPRLRGVSHQIAAFVALLAGGALTAQAPTPTSRLAAAIYTASLVALFGISAAYHRPTWQPRARQWMRRLDHSAIFLLIAGTYTPLSLGLPPADGAQLRTVAWSGALAGVLQSILWVTAPKPLIAVIYVALGWCIIPYVGAMRAAIGLGPLLWVLFGGVIYSLGALVYARRKPDPIPEVFGYHEVFHALTIVAAVIHFAVAAHIVLGAR